VLGWVREYQAAWLAKDTLAGLTVWALLIPEGLAYAALAGMAPTTLFATAPLALLAYAVLGSSRRLIVSVSSAVASMSAATVTAFGVAPLSARWTELTIELALLAGVIGVLAGLLRLGFLADFVSSPVQTGFLAGLALTIVAKELPTILGIPAGTGTFIRRAGDLVTHLGDVQGATVAVAVLATATILLSERFARRLPAGFLAVVVAIVAVALGDLTAHGVAVVGRFPGGLPRPRWPALHQSDLVALLPGAAALVLVAYAEAIGTARRLADAHGEEIDPNQELVALGGANALVGAFGGYPCGASLSKSAANDRAGAMTQVSGLVAVALTLLTALVLAPAFRRLPEATLGVIVVLALRPLLHLDVLVRFWRLQRVECALAVTAMVGVLALDLLPGLAIAVVLSILVLVFRASRPHLAILGRVPPGVWLDTRRVAGAETFRGLVVVRPNAQLFYANARFVRDQVRDLARRSVPPARCVVVDLEESETIDVTTLDNLGELLDELTALGVELRLARVRTPVLELLERSGFTAQLGAERIYPTIPTALASLRSLRTMWRAYVLRPLRGAARDQLVVDCRTWRRH